MAGDITHQSQHTTPTKKFAYDDYVLLPDDGQRYEVLDGEVVVSPAAGTPHQGLQAELLCELMLRIGRKRRGRVFTDLDCELGKHDIVRPDLIVVLPEHYERILPTHLLGWPDLAIEILSKSTASRDRNQKRLRYQAAGTRELWLVDGDAHTVTQFVHDGSKFGAPRIATESLRLAILPDVEVPFAELW